MYLLIWIWKKYEWCHEDMFFLQLDSNVHILNEQIEWYNAGQCDMMYAKELIQHKQMSDYDKIYYYWEYFICAQKLANWISILLTKSALCWA